MIIFRPLNPLSLFIYAYIHLQADNLRPCSLKYIKSPKIDLVGCVGCGTSPVSQPHLDSETHQTEPPKDSDEKD